jgi:hypothetical protein
VGVATAPPRTRLIRPKVVVSCQGVPRTAADVAKPYREAGARFLPTWPHGAVTVRGHTTGLVVETYRGKEHFFIREAEK